MPWSEIIRRHYVRAGLRNASGLRNRRSSRRVAGRRLRSVARARSNYARWSCEKTARNFSAGSHLACALARRK